MLQSEFGYALRVNRVSAYAPGRVEILGNHTDYNGGVVLAAAIDRGLTVSGFRRNDRVIRLKSTMLGREAEAAVDDLQPQNTEPWANYLLGVTSELMRAGYPVAGYTAVVDGDLAIGGGLSSSAALEVATAYFLNKLWDLQIEPRAIAQLCRRAENDFVGVASGMLDQITSVFGKADHVVYLDCESEEVQTIPFRSDLDLVIADSGSQHSLLQGQYNARRAECAAAAQALGVQNLRAISLEQLETRRRTVDPLLFRRAVHVVGENERVWRAVDSLNSGDAAAVGALMYASHESSRVNFENSTPELDLLVEIAASVRGVFGARLTGGGFGGSTVTLASAEAAPNVAAELNHQFLSRAGSDAHAFVCRVADGAAIVNGLH